MKLFFALLAFAFANESIQFTPATTKLNIPTATTIFSKDAQLTAPKGWSIGMNLQNNSTVKYEILLAPNKDLSTSDVHAGLLLKGMPSAMSLEEKKKTLEANKGYGVTYQTINGDKWLFSTHEIIHQKGFPYIEISGTLIKGNREFLLLAGYPKNQESTIKSQIDEIISTVKIKN